MGSRASQRHDPLLGFQIDRYRQLGASRVTMFGSPARNRPASAIHLVRVRTRGTTPAIAGRAFDAARPSNAAPASCSRAHRSSVRTPALLETSARLRPHGTLRRRHRPALELHSRPRRSARSRAVPRPGRRRDRCRQCAGEFRRCDRTGEPLSSRSPLDSRTRASPASEIAVSSWAWRLSGAAARRASSSSTARFRCGADSSGGSPLPTYFSTSATFRCASAEPGFVPQPVVITQPVSFHCSICAGGGVAHASWKLAAAKVLRARQSSGMHSR